MTTNLAVNIVRYVDDHQPGWVEVEFVDAQGQRHTFVDKVPGFTSLPLDAHSSYPQPGQVACEVFVTIPGCAGTPLGLHHNGPTVSCRVHRRNLRVYRPDIAALGLSEVCLRCSRLQL